eukprot:3044561-Amphidinium_carterae.1
MLVVHTFCQNDRLPVGLHSLDKHSFILKVCWRCPMQAFARDVLASQRHPGPPRGARIPARFKPHHSMHTPHPK